jgi:hypothetical protein
MFFSKKNSLWTNLRFLTDHKWFADRYLGNTDLNECKFDEHPQWHTGFMTASRVMLLALFLCAYDRGWGVKPIPRTALLLSKIAFYIGKTYVEAHFYQDLTIVTT